MKKIVVAVDFNEEVEDVLNVAAELASVTGARLDVVHVYPSTPEFISYPPYVFPGAMVVEDTELHEDLLQGQRKKVRLIVGKLQKKDLKVIGYMKPAVGEDIVRAILQFADERGSDMVIIGTHRPGRIERLVMGSTAEGIIRKSKIPILVVPRSKGEEE